MSSFGIKTLPQQTTYEALLAVWREADLIDHAWLDEHFAPIYDDIGGPCLAGWTVLAALATETEWFQIGMLVTGNTYRHPVVVARIAATVDAISHGRLDFGVGAGWNVYEHESMGIPLFHPGERIRRFSKACEIWTPLFA
jgi:alkanesulfonate monooxygenase SsuD/methylene tetrahydromethanopterin reductase-like flavin-dependent oxidoreductase (luciferase family)